MVDPFDSGPHQNLREYLGLLLGVILANIVNNRSLIASEARQSLRWIGDNRAALSWADDNKVSSRSGQIANIAVIWSQLYGNFAVNDTEHLAGLEMGDVDAASRDKTLSTLKLTEFIDLTTVQGLNSLLLACNPTVSEHSINYHAAFSLVHTCLREILK